MEINTTYLQGQDQVSGHNNPEFIIIHHPEWYGDIKGLNSMMRNMGYAMIGYNYYVRKDGTVWKGRPDNVTSANCYNYNTKSVGVCFEGDYDKDTSMPQAQFDAGVELIKYLKNKYNINSGNINGHKAFYNTDCPGRYFPLDRMLKAIREGAITNTSHNSSNKTNNKLISQHGKCTVTVDKLMIRERPSTSSAAVGSYSKGQSVYYDYYVDNEGYRWISWIGASGKRRYMAEKVLSSGKRYGNCV